MRILFAAMMIWCASFAYAADDYLEPEMAFKISAKMVNEKTIEVTFAIADGYYMYRERFSFQAEGAKLGVPVFPLGKVKFDETFQKNVETYRTSVTIALPVEASKPFTLRVMSQGCADKGLCYAPLESAIKLAPKGKGGLLAAITAAKIGADGNSQMVNTPIAADYSSNKIADASREPTSTPSDMGRIEASLKSGKLWIILPLFLLLGLGLSFTPCVLPMVPILSSIIIGEGVHVSRTRGFILSATYALGMALVYTALGVVAGLAGEGLSAALQNPWMLTAFSLLMVALALAMLGAYQLQVPAGWQMKLSQVSGRQSSGKLLGVFIMGALSAMIVGPCVAAPLAGALVYISQTRDVVIGGSALFAMALGMSVPLLLLGVSAGTLLPRAGAWMEAVKRFFGVLMLAMAVWIIAPVLPPLALMLGWAIVGVGYGGYLLRAKKSGWLSYAFGLVVLLFGMAQFVGMATGGRDALAPLANLSGEQARKTEFVRIKSSADLDAALAQAKDKMVLLDFYADWCVSCKEMEKLTFTDARIQAQFAHMLLLQVDVTSNNVDDKALLKRFNLFGPPGIIFFDKQGREIRDSRVIGYQNTEKFMQSLKFVTQS